MTAAKNKTMTNSKKQRRKAAERRRLRAFTASEASGGAGLTEEEALKLIESLEAKNTQ
jgi:hypothetical protein